MMTLVEVETIAAVSCSPNMTSSAGVRLVSGLMGKLGRAWVGTWLGAWMIWGFISNFVVLPNIT